MSKTTDVDELIDRLFLSVDDTTDITEGLMMLQGRGLACSIADMVRDETLRDGCIRSIARVVGLAVRAMKIEDENQ